MQLILVTGTTFSHALKPYQSARRTADMVGRALAQAGFGLVTGNPPGVDSVTAESFCSECARMHRSCHEAYLQLWLPHFKRGYWMPGAGFSAPDECVVRLETFNEWIEESITRANAAVMIGGRSGALNIARRFIDAGKPVFPIPFASGESRNVFQEILKTWERAPVPGLSRSQFLRLDVPWIGDAQALNDLLLGTLADTADIFISYRRNDIAIAAGRLHDDLIEHFGGKRVFMDLHDIAPSATWKDSIEAAIQHCRFGIVIIGPHWMEKDTNGQVKLLRDDDVVREEISAMLRTGKPIVPVLVDGAQLPLAEDLPPELRVLLSFNALAVDNANWKVVVNAMIRSIQSVLRGQTAAERI